MVFTRSKTSVVGWNQLLEPLLAGKSGGWGVAGEVVMPCAGHIAGDLNDHESNTMYAHLYPREVMKKPIERSLTMMPHFTTSLASCYVLCTPR